MCNDLHDSIKGGGNLGEEDEGLDVVCNWIGCILHPGEQAFNPLDGWFGVPQVGEQCLKNHLEVGKDGGEGRFCIVILDGFDEVSVGGVDLILLEEGLRECLKDRTSEPT